ncbi:MAG: hypothetical protein JWR42_92 [Marmoricola sp.]|nr:hypothetical protein [Marmoricola sp.]
MRKLFWFLVVLAVLVVGADRLALNAAEGVAATSLQDSQRLSTKPEVDVTGFPFLTQFVRRHYDEVVVSDPRVRVGEQGRRVRLRDVRVVLLDVRTNQDFSRFSAARARATATVPYAELSRLIGLRISYGGQGQVRAGKRIDVAGQQLTPSVTITPKLLGGAVSLGGSLADGSLPSGFAAVLREALGVRIPLTGLPFGVRPTSLSATAGGVRVRLVGRALRYP